ncbi:MAG TPA: hypothetical protein PKC67_07955 [Kiritimatiellia bacterium]|nr:hypothetical protein [Kiritimatiellia bacterium]
MNMRMVIGGLAGAVIGYLVYRFIGCRTGACPLTGNPYIAVALYALLGLFITRNP